MRVRDAEIEDIPSMMQLGRRVIGGLDWNLMRWDSLPSELERFVTNEHVHCIVSGPVGSVDAAIVGASMLVPWRHDQPMACVVLWWSRNPFAGLRVFREFKRRSRDEGADLIMSGARDERTGKLYARLGMRRAETNYLGGL